MHPTVIAAWNDQATVTLRNQCSGRLLRTHPNKTIDACGKEEESKPTQWRVHRTNASSLPAHIKLEPLLHPGEFLYITERGNLAIGPVMCEFAVERDGDLFVFEPLMNPSWYLGSNSDGTLRCPKDTILLDDHAHFTAHRVD